MWLTSRASGVGFSRLKLEEDERVSRCRAVAGLKPRGVGCGQVIPCCFLG